MSSTPSKQLPILTPRFDNNQRAALTPSPWNPISATSSLSAPSPAAPTTPKTPTTPSKAVSQPPSITEIPHNVFTPIYIHTAKCDKCEERNSSVLQRCSTCSIQICQSCMESGDGKHKLSDKLDWTDYGAQANSQPKKKGNGGMGPKSLRRTLTLEASELQPEKEKTTPEKNEVLSRRTVSNLTLPESNATKRRKTARVETSDFEDMNVEEVDTTIPFSRRTPRPRQLTKPNLFIDDEIEDESTVEGFETAVRTALGKRSHGDGHEDNNGAEVMHASKKGKLTQISAALANKGNALLQHRVDRPVANGESSDVAAQQTRRGQDHLIMVFNMRTKRATRIGSQNPPTASGSIIGAAASAEVDNLYSEITQLVSRREAIGQQVAVLQGEARIINARIAEKARYIDEVLDREEW